VVLLVEQWFSKTVLRVICSSETFFVLLLAVSLIICVADFVSCMKQNVSIDLQVLKFLVCLYNKIVGLDLSPFSEMVENHC